jgi:hypothetical protein
MQTLEQPANRRAVPVATLVVLKGRYPLKITRSKQERLQAIRLANFATKEHTVFMASAF